MTFFGRKLLRTPLNRLGFLILIAGIVVLGWSWSSWLSNTNWALFRQYHEYDQVEAKPPDDVGTPRWFLKAGCATRHYHDGEAILVERVAKLDEQQPPLLLLDPGDDIPDDFGGRVVSNMQDRRNWQLDDTKWKSRLGRIRQRLADPCGDSLCVSQSNGFVRGGLDRVELQKRHRSLALASESPFFAFEGAPDEWDLEFSNAGNASSEQLLEAAFFSPLPPELRSKAVEECVAEMKIKSVVVRSYPMATIEQWTREDKSPFSLGLLLSAVGFCAAFLDTSIVWLLRSTVGKVYFWIVRGSSKE